MRNWIILLLGLNVLSCAPASSDKSFEEKLSVYGEILKQSLNADTLQSYFYKLPDGTPYPVTIADETFSSRSNKPVIEKFGQPVIFMTKDQADSANLGAYFWVTDFNCVDTVARIQLADPIRNILFGATYHYSHSQWELESVYFDVLK